MRASPIALIVFVVAAFAVQHAHAFGAHVLFQVDPALEPMIAQHVGQVLSSQGDVVPAEFAPSQGDIAVVAAYAAADNGKPVLRLTYYDAVTAVALFSDDLPLRNGALRGDADAAIAEKAQSALAMVAPNTAPAPGEGWNAPPPSPPAEGDDTAATAPDAVESETVEHSVAAMLGVGGGVATYGSALPLAVGSARVSESAVPAFDVELAVDGVADGSITPGLRLAYTSTIGYTLTNTTPDGVDERSAARAHQLRVDGAINVNFGHSRRDVSLPIVFGYAWTNLRTDVELAHVYRHTLSGPHLGLALRIPLADEAVVVRVGPDACFVLQVSDRIARAGLAGSGLAFGGELELLVRLTQRFSLRALWRESHAVVSSESHAGSFTEALRVITFGAAATY